MGMGKVRGWRKTKSRDGDGDGDGESLKLGNGEKFNENFTDFYIHAHFHTVYT